MHGTPARWMEWHAQSDETLRRAVIRFENPGGPIPWFVRRAYPLAAFALHSDRGPDLAPGGSLAIDHRLTFVSP